jgi:hypothetical protein
MHCYELHPSLADVQDPCGFLGGTPSLPIGETWPKCRMCGEELVHFLDVELPEGSAPFQPGSRLQVFACRQHDDIAGTIYSDYGRFEAASHSQQLPEHFWDISDGHYLLRLLPPGTAVTAADHFEPRLALHNLRLQREADAEADPRQSLKLLGHPSWAQDPADHLCSCGAPLQLLLQVPANTRFAMTPGAPPQPNTYSDTHYLLFLGNEIYLLACPRQCHPQALWPVLQN